MTFEKFISRVTIRGRLMAETGLHIGSGSVPLDPAATDSPVIRDVAGRPFIPGSSFKGALRAHIESLVRGLSRPGSFESCDPLADPCVPNKKQNGKPGIEDLKKEIEKGKEARDENDRLDRAKYDRLLTDKIIGRSCIVCQLFGSPWLASHALIKDLFVDDSWQMRRIELRDGVGIDRDTETARQGIKYDFEVVPATTGFDLEIVAENASDDLFGLLALGLREMEQGRVALGGKTTRGLGGVRLALEAIEVVGDETAGKYDGEGSADLLDYLLKGQGRLLKGGALHQYIEDKIRALVAAKLNQE